MFGMFGKSLGLMLGFILCLAVASAGADEQQIDKLCAEILSKDPGLATLQADFRLLISESDTSPDAFPGEHSERIAKEVNAIIGGSKGRVHTGSLAWDLQRESYKLDDSTPIARVNIAADPLTVTSEEDRSLFIHTVESEVLFQPLHLEGQVAGSNLCIGPDWGRACGWFDKAAAATL